MFFSESVSMPSSSFGHHWCISTNIGHDMCTGSHGHQRMKWTNHGGDSRSITLSKMCEISRIQWMNWHHIWNGRSWFRENLTVALTCSLASPYSRHFDNYWRDCHEIRFMHSHSPRDDLSYLVNPSRILQCFHKANSLSNFNWQWSGCTTSDIPINLSFTLLFS